LWTFVLVSTQDCPRVPNSFCQQLHLDSITTSQLLLPVESFPHFTAYRGLPHFTSQLFLRSLLFWHQLKRISVSSMRVVSLFNSIVVSPNLMPIVQYLYFHLWRSLKGNDTLIVDMADISGSCLREVAQG